MRKVMGINRASLQEVKEHMTPEQIAEMDAKREKIIGTTLGFSSYEARLLAINMFDLGYLASLAEDVE